MQISFYILFNIIMLLIQFTLTLIFSIVTINQSKFQFKQVHRD